ncbi:MAG TPA: phosphatidylcholine/phosphatidylserine synthase [Phycisphaerae bacterium]|nr:phosphatidylcholine/phosphatidylserine synthase [Phycisphaerae bacterium]
MLRPIKSAPVSPAEAAARKKRRLRRIGMLPTLLTLGNLCLGVAAIYMCNREMLDLGRDRKPQDALTWNSEFLEYMAPSYLSISVWMLVGALICDALDGRVARKTGAESKFGEQMDSLADMISWGAAPALIMVTMVNREIWQWGGQPPFGYERFGQLTVLIGLIYASCAALRLARFNVETSMADASHEGFKGLPSPGAGGYVLSMVWLHDHLDQTGGWIWLADAITYVLPFCALGVALLMVSQVPYRHAASWLFKRRPFSHIIPMLLVLPLIVLYTKQTLTVVAWIFVLSGLVRWGIQKWRDHQRGGQDAGGSDRHTESPPVRQIS